ncbi:MAG: hypothetical protein A2X05_00220 [Bacteroidetes bacterium GWE2_41_25]|nr:MAG: hypothetical protein A2X03_01920 [Bacteroidetes bacterium GWA2_40_15]OFX85858.1 MAG: hypothetical protein A2X06_11105 [Bacteroidetes bacterium GWC2_40_22]OFX97431.1 MAG: hypothetical protein A2X05_00220 [Bacteroidetes bacterium GWE2_41_25]HBH85854.1 hypothetical protein [Bacteroidales bacterium]
MIKSDAKLKNIISVFSSGNKKLIAEAIDLLRDEQPFEGVIGLLVSLYDQTGNDDIKRAVESFMNDLKDQAVVPEVISEIRKGWKPQTISMLVSSCWQSGLNYSTHSSDLADVFIEGDYVTAVECMTVIEEFINEVSRNEKDEIIRKIEKSHFPPGSEKTALTAELISILKS